MTVSKSNSLQVVLKLDEFRKRKAVMENETKPSIYIKHTVHSFASYVLSDEEYKHFEHHTPTFSNYAAAETEFELVYQNILSITLHISENKLT